MLFVDSLKFKNKSNKLAVLPEPTFYEFPIIIGVRNHHCKHCDKLFF